MTLDDLALAPNPQFVRPGWVDLNGEWSFAFDDAHEGLAGRWFTDPAPLTRQITVPFAPETPLSGIGDSGRHPVLWYSRTFADPRNDSQSRLVLCFGAVDYAASVWVNGLQVGMHEGGHTPFRCDVTDALNIRAHDNTLVVRVSDDPDDVEQPRGKQDWEDEPHGIWYHRTSGIWQPVWLEIVPPVHITEFHVRFDRSRWQVDWTVDLSAQPDAGTTLELTLTLGERHLGHVRQDATGRVISGSIGIAPGLPPRSVLWSPERPNLISTDLTLRTGTITDVVASYIGLRTIDASGPTFRINGRATYLRMVLNQGYWPEGHLTAPSPEALRTDAELILALGFNGARNHQKIEDPRFLYWADRLGLLLWTEMPSAFASTELALSRHRREWEAAVRRDRNHPSVIAWVPFNESWGVNDVGSALAQQAAMKSAYHLTHSLDGTRPVIGNDGWENVIGDIFTIHDYTWDIELLHRRYADRAGLEWAIGTHFPGARSLEAGDFDRTGKPVMVTEFGGVSFRPRTDEAWYGYGNVETVEQFVEQYAAMVHALTSSDLLCGFCYTQFTDTMQETNGLVDEHRRPRVPIETIRAITRGESPGILAGGIDSV